VNESKTRKKDKERYWKKLLLKVFVCCGDAASDGA
jgi:hypothetical protein